MAGTALHGNGCRPINRLDGHANCMCVACPTPFRHLCPRPLHPWLGNPLIGQHSPGVDGQCGGWAILRRAWGTVRGLGCALMPLMLLITATNMMAVPDPQPLPCPRPPSSPSPAPILFGACDSLQPECYLPFMDDFGDSTAALQPRSLMAGKEGFPLPLSRALQHPAVAPSNPPLWCH
jgi:hypothetical protein